MSGGRASGDGASPLHGLGEGLWVAQAPLRVLGVDAGRRMSVVLLPGGGLLVHSPAPLTTRLRAALDARGDVRFVVPASHLHGHLFMEQYVAAYPRAQLLAAPGLRRKRRDLRFAADLGERPDPRWQPVLDQAVVHGNPFVTEVVLFHRPTRALLVGDLVWNVTERSPRSTRLWAGGGGVRPTRALRLAVRDRAAARRSLDRILAWEIERIVIGHGEMVESGGREALRSAYAWL